MLLFNHIHASSKSAATLICISWIKDVYINNYVSFCHSTTNLITLMKWNPTQVQHNTWLCISRKDYHLTKTFEPSTPQLSHYPFKPFSMNIFLPVKRARRALELCKTGLQRRSAPQYLHSPSRQGDTPAARPTSMFAAKRYSTIIRSEETSKDMKEEYVCQYNVTF